MPSPKLMALLNHQGEVNRLMYEAGFTGSPVLTDDELKLHTIAVDAGVPAATFVQHIIRDRRLSAPGNGWAA